MTRIVSLVLIALLTMMILTACGSASPEPSEPGAMPTVTGLPSEGATPEGSDTTNRGYPAPTEVPGIAPGSYPGPDGVMPTPLPYPGPATPTP